mmetsp:Transcript_32972/g.83501  ORF Transcript_32972/g.83501 Transcript_32972/m.83501 type:complete len:238 (+) Transcript_32972:448-1161(+)
MGDRLQDVAHAAGLDCLTEPHGVLDVLRCAIHQPRAEIGLPPREGHDIELPVRLVELLHKGQVQRSLDVLQVRLHGTRNVDRNDHAILHDRAEDRARDDGGDAPSVGQKYKLLRHILSSLARVLHPENVRLQQTHRGGSPAFVVRDEGHLPRSSAATFCELWCQMKLATRCRLAIRRHEIDEHVDSLCFHSPLVGCEAAIVTHLDVKLSYHKGRILPWLELEDETPIGQIAHGHADV